MDSKKVAACYGEAQRCLAVRPVFLSHSRPVQPQLQEQLVLLPTPLLETEWHLPFSHPFYAAHGDVAERFWRALGEQREKHGDELRRRYLNR